MWELALTQVVVVVVPNWDQQRQRQVVLRRHQSPNPSREEQARPSVNPDQVEQCQENPEVQLELVVNSAIPNKLAGHLRAANAA